jgi:hypothetical protein
MCSYQVRLVLKNGCAPALTFEEDQMFMTLEELVTYITTNEV